MRIASPAVNHRSVAAS